jgi:MFS transporter, DHA1 family, inner membrane transport protein
MEKTTEMSKPAQSRFLLPVLGLAVLSTWLVTVIFQILMIDIAYSFDVQVGTASMAASVGSISGIIFGLLMAVVNVRFNHKLLLLLGLLSTTLGTLGYYFAPSFPLLLASNIGVGGGIAIVTAMAYSIIGDVYPLEKRGRAVGVIVAATTLASVIGGPTAGFLASYGDWRMVVIALALPVVLVGLVLSALVIPKNPGTNPGMVKEPFSVGCKHAFSTVSAFAALLVTMLMFCEGAIGYYSVSFFREHFGMSVAWGSSFVLVASIVAASGGIIAGLLVNRVGRKKLGMITFVVASALTLVFTFMPTVELSALFSVVRYWFSAMAATAGGSLIIEQLPRFRSTMMSLNTAFMNVGMLLASLIGGFALNSYGYQVLGLVLGGLGLLGTVVWITLVKEPCTKSK